MNAPSGGTNLPTIVDDLSGALEKMTDLGRDIAGPAAGSIKNAIVLYGALRSWSVTRHSQFVEWAIRRGDGDTIWVVLDPLVPPELFGCNALSLRFSRVLGRERVHIPERIPPGFSDAFRGKPIGLIDDAALTGTTFTHVAALISESGGHVSHFIAGVSSVAARDAVLGQFPNATWDQFVAGDHPAIHLRDGCPLLPFSGKRLEEQQAIMTPRGPVRVATPPTVFKRSFWASLAADKTVAHALRLGRRDAAQRFSTRLGRPAVVSDIPLLGDDATLTLFPNQAVGPDSLLEHILQ